MGSYLSIVNNTPDPWHCHLGPDEKALKILSIITAGIVAGAGRVIPLVGVVTLVSGWMVVSNVNPSSLTAITDAANQAASYAKVAGSASTFTYEMARQISTELAGKVERNDGVR